MKQVGTKQAGAATLVLMLTAGLGACSSAPQASAKPGAANVQAQAVASDWVRGVDVSEARMAESGGVAFKDTDGTAKAALQIVQDHRYNWVRVRLMIDPDGNYGLAQDLPYVKATMLDAKQHNLKVLLDLHYSHWWADPGNQWTPARWQGQNLSALTTSVYSYTKDVITQLRAQGTPPDMVQIGNEINGGILWENGRISNMANFVKLTNAGAYAVQDASGGKATMPPIMVHIAKTGDAAWTVAWYKAFINAGGWVDSIGLSYYPMWHGDLNNLSQTIKALRANFSWAKVYLAETAYYWDKNQAGYANLPYPQTPQGQYDFLQALSPVVQQAGGSGIFYWGGFWSQGGKWLNAPGWNDDDASRRSLFDDNAQATKGIDGLNQAAAANTAPILQLPADLSAEATGLGGAHVTFGATATDAEDANAPAVTCTPAPGALFALGTTAVNCSATDGAGASTAGRFTVSVKDTTAPVITVANPLQDARYTLGSSVLADYGCTDAVALAGCAGSVANGAPFDTAGVGAKTFTVRATDGAGNAATVARRYTVEYPFGGFSRPVDNLPAINGVKAGSAVPVKFSLGGNQGPNVLAALSPASAPITCGSNDAVGATEPTRTAGNSGLGYDASAGQYVYVWKTDQAWAGTCRQLVLKLADGTEHRANFELR